MQARVRLQIGARLYLWITVLGGGTEATVVGQVAVESDGGSSEDTKLGVGVSGMGIGVGIEGEMVNGKRKR